MLTIFHAKLSSLINFAKAIYCCFILALLLIGWDLTNPTEATAGAVMSEAGYTTAQFGKWAHSSQVQGYEPWHAGFDESYVRSKFEPDMLLK
jgi:hypothetical protein